MKNTKDSPGVIIPPPLFYAGFFLLSMILQGYFTIRAAFFFHTHWANICGSVLYFMGICFSFPSMFKFIKSKNTIITVKPATSLQTTGIYSYSRNPMYIALLLFYLGLALQFGNWWTLILAPFLIVFITYRVILPEERYLTRAFGEEYTNYQKRVRRWI
jgi:protein-S-isoprenylcysteine O-methyltransferase Ste14